MDHTSTLAAALVLGILGSAHCAGMCGGIACAVTVGAGGAARSPARAALDVLLYNAGRIASYCAAGAVVGLAGTAVVGAAPPGPAARAVTAGVTGAFLVIVGLHLGGWASLLGPLERAGLALWRRIQPLMRPLLPARRPWQVAALGVLWGWIPCGLVYSALVLAALAATPAGGALHMLVFGAGTLPVVAGIGLAGRWIGEMGRGAWVRRGAGALMIAMGIATFALAAVHPGGESGHVHADRRAGGSPAYDARSM